MTNEEKAIELADKMIIGNQTNIEADVAVRYVVDACLKMAEWKDEQYKVLIDRIVEFLNDGYYSCEMFQDDMDDWCEKNCGKHEPNFNRECILNWLKEKIKENKKLQEISKPRSEESLRKEQLYKENKKQARIFCGCENAKEIGLCIEDKIGCYKCNLNECYITAMAMAFNKDKQYKSEIDDLLKRLHEAEERERIARKIIDDKNNELKELRK